MGATRPTAESPPAPAPEHATVDRVANLVVTILPLALLGVAMWQAWGGALRWPDLVVLAVTLYAHRSRHHGRVSPDADPPQLQDQRAAAALFAALGSAAIEGPVIEWVSNHRKHHQYSDQPGDPHSPHVDHGSGWSGALRGPVPCARGLDLRRRRARANQGALRQGPDRRPGREVHRPHIRAVGARRGSAFPFALGYALTEARSSAASPACCGEARSGSCSCTTRRSRSTRCATSSAGAASRRRRPVAQQRLAGAADARRGVAQQPPRVPDLRAPRPAPVAAGPLLRG